MITGDITKYKRKNHDCIYSIIKLIPVERNNRKTIKIYRIYVSEFSSAGILAYFCPRATPLTIFIWANNRNKEKSLYRLCNSVWDYIKLSSGTTLNLFLYSVNHY